MQLSIFDFMRDNGVGGAGQYMGPTYESAGPGQNIGADLSRMGYWNSTGGRVDLGGLTNDDQAYRSWVAANTPAEWTDKYTRLYSDNQGRSGGIGPDGTFNIPDQYLASNMQEKSFLGPIGMDAVGPLMLMAPALGGIMAAAGAGLGAGAGAASGLTGAEMGGLWAGDLAAAGNLTTAAGAGGADWFQQLMQNYNPDLGFQGLNEAGSGLTGGMGTGGGLPDILQKIVQFPGGSQIAQQLLNSVTGQGGGAGGGTGGAGGLNLGSLLPLLGIGSGLNTMFGRSDAVDPNMIAQLWRAGQNTYNTAQDPQNALHDRTQQQVVDASRAGQSARGIAMSPYGAGLENKAVSDFNIDWQNQQLQRQMQGTQAFAGAGNMAATAGVANNAQAFLQNQTGLNNLTTGLQGLTGGGQQGGAQQGSNPIGSWLGSLFGAGAGGGGSLPTYNGGSNYNAAGTFQPYYNGYDSAGGPAYG